jgi:hypothetical protein
MTQINRGHIMKHKTTIQEIKSITPDLLVLHPEALATPKMNDIAFEALKLDIEVNGQIEPVLTYRNRIVDGRHRWLVLQELEIAEIRYVELPNNTTIQEIKRLVQSKETRRHETAGQLAIRAYRLKMMENSEFKSFTEASIAVGANRKRVSEVKKIIELYGRNDIIETLFDGKQFNTGKANIPFYTDSLGTILRWLEEHGTVIGAKSEVQGVEPRTELSPDEQLLINSYVNAIKKEGELVMSGIANTIYAHINGNEPAKC